MSVTPRASASPRRSLTAAFRARSSGPCRRVVSSEDLAHRTEPRSACFVLALALLGVGGRPASQREPRQRHRSAGVLTGLFTPTRTVQTRGTALLMNDFGEEVRMTNATVLSELLTSSLGHVPVLACLSAGLRDEVGSARRAILWPRRPGADSGAAAGRRGSERERLLSSRNPTLSGGAADKPGPLTPERAAHVKGGKQTCHSEKNGWTPCSGARFRLSHGN